MLKTGIRKCCLKQSHYVWIKVSLNDLGSQMEHIGVKFILEFYIRYNRPTHRQHSRSASKVGPLGVVALCDDCTFIPADWGS